MKKLVNIVVILLFFALTGCTNNDNEQEVTKKSDNNYLISIPLNFEIMKQFYDEDVKKGIDSQFANLEQLDPKQARIELEISSEGELADAKGAVFFKEGSYDFNGSGFFKEFTSPDTKKTYYYGDIEGNEGFNFVIFFSEEDNRAYLETTVPVKIGNYEYHAIFGEKFVNKDYWDALFNQNEATDNDNDGNNSAEVTIDLPFTPVPTTTLKEGLPKEEWIKGKSIYFGNLSNQIESTVHLYIDNTVNPDLRPDEGMIYGFLEHENKFYELGAVSSYRIDDVNVNLEDRTSDGIKEIEIEGGMGATYLELKIISFNEINNEWENLLTMGSPNIVDLDGDGQDELTAGSAGSLPPYLDIYKWNNDHFEKSDVGKATKSNYASLYTIDGTWFIETGVYENSKTSEQKLYKYRAGKLIEKDR
ncbi:MAG: hypothetical protein AB7V48_13890 [Sedimentibacter sp.]